MVKFLKAWLPVIVMCSIIFLLSQDSASGRHSDLVLGWMLDVLGMNTAHLRHLLDPGFRKFAHVSVYFCLAGLSYRGFAMGHVRWTWSAAVRSLVFCAVYAATDEYHQSFIHGRGPEVRDVFIDTAGAALCLMLIWLWMRSRSFHDTEGGGSARLAQIAAARRRPKQSGRPLPGNEVTVPSDQRERPESGLEYPVNMVESAYIPMPDLTRRPRPTLPWATAIFPLAVVTMVAVTSSGCLFHHNQVNTNPLAAVHSAQPDKTLFDIAMSDLDKGKYTVARLNLETLLNTYPDSEYLARAKMAIADSWYREGGIEGMAQAEAQYRDFITFFPAMKEASEAQLKIAQIHYKQLQKPDRDPTQALRAQAELRTFLLNYPDSPLRPQAVQMLRDTQEVLAEREYRIADFYLERANQGEYPDYRPAQSRLEEMLKRYPLYSQGDVALDQLAHSYETTSQLYAGAVKIETQPQTKELYVANQKTDHDKAIADFGLLAQRYPVSPMAKDAALQLKKLGAPVPTATAEAVAFNKQEIAGHQKAPPMHGWRQGFGLDAIVSGKPATEIARADKVGEPSLSDPQLAQYTPPPGLTNLIRETLKASGANANLAATIQDVNGSGQAAGDLKPATPTTTATAETLPTTPAKPLQFQDVPTTKARGADTPQTATPQAVAGNNNDDPNARQAAPEINPNLILTPNEVDIENREQMLAADIHRQVPATYAELKAAAELQMKQREQLMAKIRAEAAKHQGAAAGKPVVTPGQAEKSDGQALPAVTKKKSWFHIW